MFLPLDKVKILCNCSLLCFMSLFTRMPNRVTETRMHFFVLNLVAQRCQFNGKSDPSKEANSPVFRDDRSMHPLTTIIVLANKNMWLKVQLWSTRTSTFLQAPKLDARIYAGNVKKKEQCWYVAVASVQWKCTRKLDLSRWVMQREQRTGEVFFCYFPNEARDACNGILLKLHNNLFWLIHGIDDIRCEILENAGIKYVCLQDRSLFFCAFWNALGLCIFWVGDKLGRKKVEQSSLFMC